MIKKTVFILLLLAVFSTGCVQEPNDEELTAIREYCDQFNTEDVCDLESCEWALKVGCINPETNCGFGYNPKKQCVPKGYGFESP
jgi:hypothetical protein